jgi:hypothetical protein
MSQNGNARHLIVAVAVLTGALGRASEPVSIVPSDTDSRINEFNSPHLVWTAEGTARNQLLVYLPGTGGTPEKGVFHGFAKVAAGLGYHVVAVMYPDNIAAQRKCGQSLDLGCQLAFRNSILHGGRIGPRRVVAPEDTIENRLEKLLAYLDAHFAGEGWGQYRGPQGVRWAKIAVAGQSQGGGHSYVIGKNHEVARVLMFGSPKDYNFHFDAPAKGFDDNTKTPLNRFFAYNHVRDNGNGCTHAQQEKVLLQMGLLALGVGDAAKPEGLYGHARVIYTNADLGESTKFHASVMRLNLAGNVAVWKYMLTE